MFPTVVLCIIVLLLLLFYLEPRKPKGYPPGPKWWPILGCAIEMARLRQETGSLFKTCSANEDCDGRPIGLFYEARTFGSRKGRHRCMGENLARSNMFIITTALLQAFTFSPVPGEEKPSSQDFIDGVTAGPKPFRAMVSFHQHARIGAPFLSQSRVQLAHAHNMTPNTMLLEL